MFYSLHKTNQTNLRQFCCTQKQNNTKYSIKSHQSIGLSYIKKNHLNTHKEQKRAILNYIQHIPTISSYRSACSIAFVIFNLFLKTRLDKFHLTSHWVNYQIAKIFLFLSLAKIIFHKFFNVKILFQKKYKKLTKLMYFWCAIWCWTSKIGQLYI